MINSIEKEIARKEDLIIGQKLVSMREAVGLSQGEVEIVLRESDRSITMRTIQRYESGDTPVPHWVYRRYELLVELAAKAENKDQLKKAIKKGTNKITQYFYQQLKNKITQWWLS